MNAITKAKEKLIFNYFVIKLAKSLFPFFFIILLVLGAVFVKITSGLSLAGLVLILFSSIGASLLMATIISIIVVYNRINSGTRQEISYIYFLEKNELELMLEEEIRIKRELSSVRIVLPVDTYSDDLRKKLEKIQIKICLTKTELSLFEYY